MSGEPSTCEAGGKRKEREKHENNPCMLPTKKVVSDMPSTYEARGNIQRKNRPCTLPTNAKDVSFGAASPALLKNFVGRTPASAS